LEIIAKIERVKFDSHPGREVTIWQQSASVPEVAVSVPSVLVETAEAARCWREPAQYRRWLRFSYQIPIRKTGKTGVSFSPAL
jgi:hypothetical protein